MNEAEVQQRARLFISRLDLSNIKSDLSSYVEAANAKVRYEELERGESAYTVTLPSKRHSITVNSLESPRRQRFSICHEVAHLQLGLPSSHGDVPAWSHAKRDPNEIMCDVFAAELLMPYTLWVDEVPPGEPSPGLIQHMADSFQASFQTAASRFAALSPGPCAYVTMSAGIVRYAARSVSLRRRGAFIPSRSPIPEGSVAHHLRGARSGETQTDTVAQDVWFQDWERGYQLNEMARHDHRFDETIALIWFDEDEMPEVELTRFGTREIDDGGLPELTGELPWPTGKRR